ncbi:hypothetical protein PHYBLDRAFT_68295 [Phycomyces blakesleeanus NRRL 1555(-)]|uniref:Response regulatory domain-containing protein n=1 Tax=Phycomyces blakesleeanus (strain ATCC 8743b / DSM 1359 / FGSC 10004 / NBRC 33097 / NRRL 1555) TaxID=763407 RepID=A0A167KEQ3_PHYB8|nr:hypothetical protein PHYBLDRAFT_68295 [Phycomyces blakesleeanus NRRL 1555(-)]OAD67925.1 hypothetical protein PHYBLDRAFT_68295 [Phycomyces blakesleeanus NRRL 1555(-)]|eukprot:XP_018285965.1 hypothetical protein PHYBLDRAFT_68295 [Phycomyces blakesleeanus NRRL 1555(-)]
MSSLPDEHSQNVQEPNKSESSRDSFAPSKDHPPVHTLASMSRKKNQHSSRPSLVNLRSAWSSEFTPRFVSESNQITLPEHSFHLQDQPILQEIKHLALVVSALCLGNAVYVVRATTSGGLLVSIPVVGWAIYVVWILLHNKKDQRTLQLGYFGAIATGFIQTLSNYHYNNYHYYHYSHYSTYEWVTVGNNLIIAVLFYGLQRLWSANFQGRKSVQDHYTVKQQDAQSHVNEHLEKYTQEQTTFIKTITEEIQDAALMVLTTLEQFSPSSLLTNTHELLNACSIPVPVASVTAIHTTIRQVFHMSAHLQLLSQLVRQNTRVDSDDKHLQSSVQLSFDVGEMVQSVGDAIAGMASQLDVGFVIYHSDNVLHHATILGDEDAIQHTLISLLRNILEGSTPGACIELGLNIVSVDTGLKVTFEIIHTVSPAIPPGLKATLLPNPNLTTRLIQYIGGELVVEDLGKQKTRFEVTLEGTSPGNSFERPLERNLSSLQYSREPTLGELVGFIGQLKGVKLVLHAPEKSVFAKHLTSCLASWNTDISHIPISHWDDTVMEPESVDTSVSHDSIESSSANSGSSQTQIPKSVSPSGSLHSNHSATSQRSNTSSQVPSPALEEDNIRAIPPAFILIDDDAATLKAKLNEFRSQPPASSSTLQAHHQQSRRKHKTQMPHNFFHQGTTGIIFFTSLHNYRDVRSILQVYIGASQHQLPFSMPRVVVVPKPAGPRRFLTAIHTAWNNAIVEPQFLPIATSPSHALVSAHGMSTPVPEKDDVNTRIPDLNAIGTEIDGSATNEMIGGDGVSGVSGGSAGAGSPPSELQRRAMANSGGLFTTSVGLVPDAGFEKGNYFFEPMHQSSSGKRHARAQSGPFVSPGRRALAASDMASDYVTIGSTNSGQISGHIHGQGSPTVGSPLKQTIAPLMEDDTTNNNNSLKITTVVSSPAKSTGSSNHNSGQLGDASVVSLVANNTQTIEAAQTTAKVPTKKSMRFKISNRKKKDKGKGSGVSSPPIKVLIVEDNMINQAILSTWMKKHKIKYEVASDGREAVDKWKKGGFHLVLMDIQLPVMSGIDATKTIRSIEKEQKIGVLPTIPSFHHQQSHDSTLSDTLSLEGSESMTPGSLQVLPPPPSPFRSPVIIVALTASSLESDRQAALAAGCNDFLTKPVSLEWLEQKIMEWGCMQALIDFEGWRKWKQAAQPLVTAVPTKTTIPTTTEGENEAETTVLSLPKVARSSSQRQGIVLPGASGLAVRRREDRSTRRPNPVKQASEKTSLEKKFETKES